MTMRILFVMYGWEDSGGGTMLPRAAATALAARGHDVRVFHAGVGRLTDEPAPYQQWLREDTGVRLHGIYHRRVPFHAVENPDCDLDDPGVRAPFEDLLDTWRPDAAHVHNLHGLGASLLTSLAEREIPTWFTPHNLWVACPSLYLLDDRARRCDGPGDGAHCGPCHGRPELATAFSNRRRGVREALIRSGAVILAPSTSVRDILIQQGIPAGQIRLLYQGHEPFDRIWTAVGARRQPRPPDGPVRFGSVGTVSTLKGAHVLAAAARQLTGPGRIHIHGDVPDGLRASLEAEDAEGRLQFHGRYSYQELPGILESLDVALVTSISDDCAPLAISECHAARVPVIGSRIGGIPDFIRDGIDGRIVPARDAEALAAAMNDVMADPLQIARWQEAIQPPRSFQDYLNRLETLYRGNTLPEDRRDRPRAVRICLRREDDPGALAADLAGTTALEAEVLDHLGRRVLGHELSKPPDASLQEHPPRQGLWLQRSLQGLHADADGQAEHEALLARPDAVLGWRGRTPARYRIRSGLADFGPALDVGDTYGPRILLWPEWQDDPWQEAIRRFMHEVPAESGLAMVLRIPPGRPELLDHVAALAEEAGAGEQATPDIIVVDQALVGDTAGMLYRACHALWSLGQPHQEADAHACGLTVLKEPTREQLLGVRVRPAQA